MWPKRISQLRISSTSLSKRHTSSSASTAQAKPDKRERIVILGSGWAGYGVARGLSPRKFSRVLVSPRSHFVFTPLLASTTVGTIEFRAALEPTRRLKPDEYHQAWASGIDFDNKKIRVQSDTSGDLVAVRDKTPTQGPQFDVPYDKLVLAVGCYSQTFGIEGVKEHASFLRDVGQARQIRIKVLQAFEKADLPTTSDEEKKKLLHFAVVGGGPTGIEFAAELHDLIHDDLSKVYPRLMQHVGITIYDIAPKVLPMFDQNLADYAMDMFRRQGINVKTEHSLERIRRDGDVLMLKIKEEPEEVGAGVVVWSTGLMQNPLVKSIAGQAVKGLGNLAMDTKTGGLIVDDRLRVQIAGENGGKTRTLPDVYALGDCVKVQSHNLPATAQVANQQATYLGKHLNKGADRDPNSAPFQFRNWGVMAYLGSYRAIHQSRADELKGRAAWLLWRTAYMTKSMSLRNKIMIPWYWLMTWIFGRDISRF